MNEVICNTKEELFLAIESIAEKWDWSLRILVKYEEALSKRSLEANAMMWALLTQLEKRATWHGEKFNREEWKDILSAGFEKERRSVKGIGGGLVYLGQRTSKYSVKKMSQFIEFIYWFSGEKPEGLEFSGFVDSADYSQYPESDK